LFERIKKDFAGWFVVVAGFLLLLEIFVLHPGLIFSFLISIGLMYYGKRGLKGKTGKLMFWAGLLVLLISVLNMFTVKFLLFSLLFYWFVQFIQNKNNKEVIKPIIKEKKEGDGEDIIIKKEPMFRNRLFHRNETPDHVYEWKDINIQTGASDTIIDLSYTVLPQGETVISIRNLVGNVKIYIPYDLEVSINHSVLLGSASIFDEVNEGNAFNLNVIRSSAAYDQAETRVKIITSFLVGNLEVKRI